MKKNAKLVLTGLLGSVLIFCGITVAKNLYSYSDGDRKYELAAEVAYSGKKQLPEQTDLPLQPAAAPEEGVELWVPLPVEGDPQMQNLEQVDIAALQNINADVIGWIRIPDSKVDYPIVQGEDNEYYLNHIWEGGEHYMGSIFMECQSDPSFTDWNTLVYGHNMSNGSMFGTLKKYNSYDFFAAHPYVYIAAESGVVRYEIFSAYMAGVESKTFGLSYSQQQTREDYLQMAVENSVINTGVVPQADDQILTLSTCSGTTDDTRWVVHARLPMQLLEEK